jgi:TonB family protein
MHEWNQWEGQIVEGKYPLRRLLGGTAHSVVFLTQTSDPQPKDAAIKLILADAPGAAARLAFWKRGVSLSHPNLLAIYDAGTCRLGDQNNFYMVTEYAEENLSEILPQRALSAEEVKDILAPALDVLVYLHGRGFAHGHLKPSNFLATQDCLKLSSDALQALGEKAEFDRQRDVYDAPETTSEPASGKSDVWALGVTLVEALTQHPPVIPPEPSADPGVPDSLPALYGQVASQALRRNPKQRWSVADIAAHLNPAPLAAAAAAASASARPAVASSPLSVPLSPEPAVPLAKLQADSVAVRTRETPVRPRTDASWLDRLLPLALGAAVILGLIFALPKMFNFRSSTGAPATSSASEPTTAKMPSAPAQETAAVSAPSPAQDTPAAAAGSSVEKRPERPAVSDPPAAAQTDSEPALTPKPASDLEGRGQVLDQVLPQASAKALSTIQGTVRVIVKVDVDAAGNVSDAELEDAGPSEYFAGLAVKAARQWKFSGAEQQGHGIPSAWVLRFEFNRSGVHASSQQSRTSL